MFSEKIELFQGKYQEYDFSFVCDPRNPSALYLYNPETIVKIERITAAEIADQYYIQKRYEESLTACPDTNTYLLSKIQSGYISSLVLQRNKLEQV